MGMNNNEIAVEVPTSFVPELVWTDPETGLTWLYLPYSGYDEYKSRAQVVYFRGRHYQKMGHNSDTGRMCYKETSEHDIMKELRKSIGWSK